MPERFDPRQVSSYEEIPEEHKARFISIEAGKGFVLKTAEKDPEIAYRLAKMEDGVIDKLRMTIETGTFSLEEALSAYEEAAAKRDYNKMNVLADQLRVFCDFETLRGGSPDPRVLAAFTKGYERPSYSEATLKVLSEETEPGDTDVVIRLLSDEKFAGRGASQLLKKVSKAEDRRKIFDGLSDNPQMVYQIIIQVKDLDEAISLFRTRRFSDTAVPVQDERLWVQQRIAEQLLEKGDMTRVLSLLKEGQLEGAALYEQLHLIESDEAILEVARSCARGKEVIYALKFITDAALLEGIAQDAASSFTKVDAAGQKTIAERADLLAKTIKTGATVTSVDGLSGRGNKFIVGIPEDGGGVHVAWSNTDSHEYHKDIFRSLSSKTGKRFPEELRSGGYVTLSQDEQGRIVATFDRSSGDFGKFSHRLMEQFREQILPVLKQRFDGQEVVLVIKKST